MRTLCLFFVGAALGASVLGAVTVSSVGGPWYWGAVDGAMAIALAVLFRRILRPPPPCGAVHALRGDPAFCCRRAAGHRGDHREGVVAWDASGLFYTWRGHRRETR